MPSSPAPLGPHAMGSIEPEPRAQSGEISAEQVGNLAKRLQTDEFYDEISVELGPNAAGGTFTLVVADALTASRFRPNGENAKNHAKNVYSFLVENCNDEKYRKIIPRVCIDGRSGDYHNDSVIGGHDDEHGPDGCGAQKFLAQILAVIRDDGDAVRQFATDRGMRIDDDTHNFIVQNASRLLETGYVVDGAQLREAYVETAGPTSVTTLQGKHNEVAASLNTAKDKTLNRQKVRDAFGDAYEAFNADLAVLPEATAVISVTAGVVDDREAEQKYVAAVYYQIATTLYLGGRSLVVVDR